MANKMLIDASHPEETRVVVVRGSRIEEFDFESEHKKQLKGNIYLAKVTRVEPSLQAAFIEYGGNRHGFLAFSEIHPDYYQIPVADRQALIEEELARAEEDEESEDRKAAKPRARSRRPSRPSDAKAADAAPDESVSEFVDAGVAESDVTDGDVTEMESDGSAVPDEEDAPSEQPQEQPTEDQPQPFDGDSADAPMSAGDDEFSPSEEARARPVDGSFETGSSEDEADHVEETGSEDAMEEVPVRQRAPRRHYKIQEVIKRRQILLVQVVKEERGNKGAALTTYLSLAGRYSVLMPNTARGGGISRKITNAADRKRLKEVARDLEVPRGMGIILRTAGANRTKAEVKRDYEYLMRLWETVRTLTLTSTAPALVYEEGSLIKRSIRDLYNKDIDQILVAGENGYREAKDFMRMLMPSQAKVVQPYREPVPIFARQGIEAQLDKMLQPNVTLKSGGYIIINQTEALVAIDVNSGRSTREHSVEDTAYQTNMEAAEEVARQLRLRDMAGLIVIDFIDMEEKRNNRNVEKKLKDCLKDDRARIQLGRISHFGLMEMSRQRIRASVLESTMQTCPTCGGMGHIRSDSSLALHVLRAIEEHVQKHGTHDLIVKVPTVTALYVLNEKRDTLDDLERNHGLRIIIQAEEGRGHQHVSIEHGAEAVQRPRPEPVQLVSAVSEDMLEDEETVEDETGEEPAANEGVEAQEEGSSEQDDATRRRKRRRRRRGGEDELSGGDMQASDAEVVDTDSSDDDAEGAAPTQVRTVEVDDDGHRRRRRRGRRGGRRNRDEGDADLPVAEGDADLPVMDVAGGAGSEEAIGLGSIEAIAAASIDSDEDGGDDEERADPSGDLDLVGMLEPGSEAEMVEAVDALDAQDPEEVTPFDSRSGNGAVVPDENEIMSAAAEASSAIDGVVPLDEVYPDIEDATSDDNEIVMSEIEAASDQPDHATRVPRITANGMEPEDAAADYKPKRTGWWARRSFF